MVGERLFAIALGALWLASCGSRSQSEGRPADFRAFFAEYQSALCEAASRCCSELPSPRACAAELSYPFELLQAGARSEFYVYRPDAAQRCLESIRSASMCDAGPLPVVCYSIFEGQLRAGEPCQANAECHAPADFAQPACLPAADGTMGCSQAKKLGESCGATCANDGTCYVSGSGRGACYLSTGLYCPVLGNACAAVGEVGAPCDTDFACSSWVCGGEGCRDAAARGAACGFGVRCAQGLYCDNQICVAQTHAPEACSGSDDPACVSGCDQGHCQANSVVCAR